MKKDVYWFQHDSNALRDPKMMELKHIYDFWGVGVYWSIIEMLRDQPGYKFKSDEGSLKLGSSLVMCSDTIRFLGLVKDCVKIGLLFDDGTHLFSQSLIERMQKWEIKKINGSKGGRPSKTETITESKPNHKAKRKQVREENITINNIYADYISFINSKLVKKYRGDSKKIESQFFARLDSGYAIDDFKIAIENASKDEYHISTQFKYLTPEFFTRADKLDKFINSAPTQVVEKQNDALNNKLEYYEKFRKEKNPNYKPD